MEIEELKRDALVNTEGVDEDEALELSGVTGKRQTNADDGEQDALDNRTKNATAGVQTEQQRAEIIIIIIIIVVVVVVVIIIIIFYLTTREEILS